MRRIESIDYLRGLMAVSVVIYHYTAWAISHGSPGEAMDAGNILMRLGVYAVSTFYIISGLSLYIAYQGKLGSTVDAAAYMTKRIFRIFPLFWLVFSSAIALGLLSAFLKGENYSFPLYEAILNYTLTFGFIDPSAYITVGAWSIGNEMVFYAIFAAVMLLSVRWPAILPFSILLSISVGVWFAYQVLTESRSLADQWGTYINPFNQVLLFFLGVAIGRYADNLRLAVENRIFWLIVLSVGVAVFVFYPIAGDSITLVTGHARLVFVATCAIVVLALFVLDPVLTPLVSRPLKFLGETSYSIYLMHSVVAWPIVFVGNGLGIEIWLSYCVAFVVTLVVGWATFNYLETPMMKVGKVVAAKFKPQTAKKVPVAW